MPSLRSRLFVFMMRNRHWLKFQPKPKNTIDWDTSIPEFRKKSEQGTKVFGKLPDAIKIAPTHIDHLYAEWIETAATPKEKVILYFHGGGYVSGSRLTHRTYVAKLVQGSGIRALLFEYRLAPEHPFPAALDDALTAYNWLLAQGTQPANIVFIGDSAGGGLLLATLIALKDKGLPSPATGVCLSPWTDLACTGESLVTVAKIDPFTPGNAWTVFSHYYIGDHDPRLPWISPLYGDLRGLPPLLIYAGDHDVLVDDSTRFAEKATAASVEVTLRVGEGLFHCYPVFSSLFPEAQQAMSEICAYINTQLATRRVTSKERLEVMEALPIPQ
jgi:epsilon-lactone hydrolase